MTNLAAAIQAAHAANEQKLSAEIRIPALEPDGTLLLEPWNRFAAFHGIRNLGVRPQVVAAFVRSEASLGVEPPKIAMALSAIELLHDRHGLANPVATAVVRAELERVLQIDPPRSWKKSEQLLFATLAPEIRAVISKREQERECWFRNKQNELAELKRELTDGAAKPVTNTEETKSVDQEAK